MILEFGLPILDYGRKLMNETTTHRFPNSCTDNLKSKIKKRPRGLKWLVLCVLLFALSIPVEAQQTDKVYRIGVLRNARLPASYLEAFKRGLRDHGYIEGKNIVIELKHGRAAAELVSLGVHVIVAVGTGRIRRAMKATKTIPIVMAPSADAVRGGLIHSLARPGGNVTGLTMITPDLAGKRLGLLREAVPSVTRVAAVFTARSSSTAVPPWLKETEKGAMAHGLGFQKLGLKRDPSTWDRAFKGVAQELGSALVVIENARFISNRTRIAELAARHRLPAMFSIKEHVEAGGLLSYGPDLAEVNRRAASYVDKILRGANPATLPVEQPRQFDLVINLKAAKKIGITISPQFLARADRVIK